MKFYVKMESIPDMQLVKRSYTVDSSGVSPIILVKLSFSNIYITMYVLFCLNRLRIHLFKIFKFIRLFSITSGMYKTILKIKVIITYCSCGPFHLFKENIYLFTSQFNYIQIIYSFS